MTEREVLPEEGLRSWRDYDPGGIDPDFDYHPDYDFDPNYDFGPDYGLELQQYRHVVEPAPSRRRQRASRLLLFLIGLAAATLVVATALLVTGNFSGEIPANPRLESRTSSAPVSSTSRPVTSSTTTTSPASSATSPPEPSSGPGPEPIPAPSDLAPADSQPPAPPSERSNPQGPRINVTRTPMSFTPGIRGN